MSAESNEGSIVIRRLATDLWVSESPLRFGGLEMGARMTVVRLPGPKLLLHSPIAASANLAEEVAALGPVSCIVAPNRLHHLFVEEWQRLFPEALTYVAPGLETKRSDLAVDGVLGDGAGPIWEGELEQIFLEGFPFANEVVFFHRKSATLIASDLAFNIGPESPLFTRLAFRLIGTPGQLAPSLLERLLVRDRKAFRDCLERILDWPFERVVIAHGAVCETGGREQLIRGYSWLLRQPS